MPEKTGDAGVSVDDTWQRKGVSTTFDVVTAISIDRGKVLDVSILFKDVPVWQRFPSPIQSYIKYGSCHANVI